MSKAVRDERHAELEAAADRAAALEALRKQPDEPHAASHDVPEWAPTAEWLAEQDRLSLEMRAEAAKANAPKPAEKTS
jgi:hypothetical protein